MVRPSVARAIAVAAALCAAGRRVPAQSVVQASQKDSFAVVYPRHLDGGRDTNSAGEYALYAISVMRSAPAEAERAFYWVSRLDPRRADGFYGQYVAWFCADPRRTVDENRDRSQRDRVFEQRWSAFLRDPFIGPRLDRYLTALVRREAQRGFAIDQTWEAMAEGRYEEAVRRLRQWMADDKDNPEPFIELAIVAYQIQQYDSAATYLQQAIDLRRKATASKFQSIYKNNAMIEYATGQAYLAGGKRAEAKAAYGRAIAEDLAFYMAHVRLAALDATERDTAAAISEFETAIQLEPNDAGVRYDYAVVLARAGQDSAAAVQLRSAIHVDEYFAQPYLLLASVEDRQGHDVETIKALDGFIAHAAHDDIRLDRARARLAQLRPAP